MQRVIPPPSNAATKADHYSDTLQPVLSALKSLPARPSLGAASSLLLENGFRCMAATNGGLESTRGLFKNALGDQVAERWEYYSCDEVRVAKPAPSVYAAIRKRLEVGRDDESWFVASHTWSVEDSFRVFIGPGLAQGTDNCVSPSIGISLLPKKQGELRLPRSHFSSPVSFHPCCLADLVRTYAGSRPHLSLTKSTLSSTTFSVSPILSLRI